MTSGAPRRNRFAWGAAPTYPGRRMTNAREDFSLDAELDETTELGRGRLRVDDADDTTAGSRGTTPTTATTPS